MNTENQTQSQEQATKEKYYRFRLLQGKVNAAGQLENIRKVGIAYLVAGAI